MRGIFETFAPLYWEAGIQAIPLKPKEKRPADGGWQRWCIEKIPHSLQQAWLTRYPDGNIGVPSGPSSGLCFIDIDTFDEKLLKAVEDAIPGSPWRRVGAKGCVLAYKFNGIKSFKIKADNIGVEFFCTSGQIVMPPSIHPDTQKPYVSTTNLWDVYKDLPDLREDVEQVLRKCLRDAGVVVSSFGHSRLIDKVSKGSRDNAMIHHCGLLAFEIKRGKCTLLESFNHLESWGYDYVEQCDGDNLDVGKGKARIVQFLIRDVHERKQALPKGWDDGVTPELRAELGLDVITEDDVSLDYDEIQNRFLTDLQDAENRGGAHAMKLNVADIALRRISKSQSLKPLEVEALTNMIASSMPKGSMSRGSLNRQLRSLQREGIEGSNHAEIAQAVLEDFPDIMMKSQFDSLWEWCGSHWAVKDRHTLLKHIIDSYGHMPAARKHADYIGIYKSVLEKVTAPLRNVTINGINFSNGFLTTDLKLVPHDPHFGMTYEMPYEYRPELSDHAPKFMNFLNESFDGDQEMIDVIQEAIAVTLFGMAPKFDRCFLLYGVAHSGKSVMLDIISSLVPPQVRCTVPPHRMNERFMIAQLHGKLMNYAGELPDNRFIESSSFKGIVSGEPISGEFKNRDAFEFKPECAHWFASNHLPKTNDISAGFLRRWLILGFNKAIPEYERNVNLSDEIIIEEREAIAAWGVEGLLRVIKNNRLTLPKMSISLLEELSSALNPIRNWYRDRTSKGSEGLISEEIFYSDYSNYSLMKGYKRLDRSQFRITMRELADGGSNFTVVMQPNGSHDYSGLKLRPLK